MPVLNILMRFAHIISAITLLGGVLVWLLAISPALVSLSDETRGKVENAIVAAWRPVSFASIGGLLVSGIYNFLNKTNLTPAYHAVIGVKFLLVLHVFAVVIVALKPDNSKRTRQLTGVAVSGVLIVILSAVLRWILTQ